MKKIIIHVLMIIPFVFQGCTGKTEPEKPKITPPLITEIFTADP